MKNEGHAGLWLEGFDGGSVSVTVTDCKFFRTHDGIEIAGPSPGGEFEADLTVLDCLFQDNENGVEVVGQGSLETFVSNCMFIDNYNGKPGANGTDNSSPISCIIIAGMSVKACVRDCLFQNFSVGVTFLPFSGSMTSCLDMGRELTQPVCCSGDVPGDSPGGNVFVLPSTWNPQVEPFKVALWNLFTPTGTPQFPQILASKNTWLPLNQGADANGCLLGSVSGIVVTPPDYTLGPGQDRNYGIADPGTGIDFGTQCPP